MKHVYLFFTVIGLVLPYTQLIPFMEEFGVDMPLLFQMGFANSATSLFMIDLLLVGTVATIYIISDGAKHNIRYRWFPVIGIFLVGICFGLPFYLYLKERQRNT